MKELKLLLAVAFLALLFSCRTQKQTGLNYLENMRDTTMAAAFALQEPVIQKGDILSIRVFSMSIDPRTDIPYNLPEAAASSAGTTGAITGGFLVDQNGNIEYPRLGLLRVEGLTREQLSDLIKNKLKDQLNQPSVTVRFVNYRVTVLGEVRNPGTYTVPYERVSILEALGLAGDITEFGRRNTVKIKREFNGQLTIGTIDLTSKDMFSSPYFRLQQNDVVMVEQSGKRQRQQEQQNLAQQVGIATGIITTIALILNLIK
jgi:polysaccharide export outer membrane protein